jgi:hypothetical protein
MRPLRILSGDGGLNAEIVALSLDPQAGGSALRRARELIFDDSRVHYRAGHWALPPADQPGLKARPEASTRLAPVAGLCLDHGRKQQQRAQGKRACKPESSLHRVVFSSGVLRGPVI